MLRQPWIWAPLYALLWFIGYGISSYYWFLPAGLRIGCLLVAPRRMWPWLLVGEGLEKRTAIIVISHRHVDGEFCLDQGREQFRKLFVVAGQPDIEGAIAIDQHPVEGVFFRQHLGDYPPQVLGQIGLIPGNETGVSMNVSIGQEGPSF